jgi:alpha/beta superfamily hydrolase
VSILEIPGPEGRLEARLDEPPISRQTDSAGLLAAAAPNGPRAAVVLAHPHPLHGGTMNTKAVFQAAKALTRIGCAVLRFNFRGAGTSSGAFSNGPGEMADCRAALDFVHERFPRARLWCGGMSFGAWVGMIVGAEDPRVSTLIGIAPPLTRYDFETVRTSPKPKFFIHGEFDDICPLKDMRAFYARADEPKELVVIDAADHLFDGRVSEVADAIEDLLGDWQA